MQTIKLSTLLIVLLIGSSTTNAMKRKNETVLETESTKKQKIAFYIQWQDASDDEGIEISREAAFNSITIKLLHDEVGFENNIIPLRFGSKETIENIVHCLELIHDREDDILVNFINKLDLQMLFELLLAANFFDIQPRDEEDKPNLLNLCIREWAKRNAKILKQLESTQNSYEQNDNTIINLNKLLPHELSRACAQVSPLFDEVSQWLYNKINIPHTTLAEIGIKISPRKIPGDNIPSSDKLHYAIFPSDQLHNSIKIYSINNKSHPVIGFKLPYVVLNLIEWVNDGKALRAHSFSLGEGNRIQTWFLDELFKLESLCTSITIEQLNLLYIIKQYSESAKNLDLTNENHILRQIYETLPQEIKDLVAPHVQIARFQIARSWWPCQIL